MATIERDPGLVLPKSVICAVEHLHRPEIFALVLRSAMKLICGVLVVSLLYVGTLAQTDTDILNFALQLECLEAEFYNYAAGNGGLPAADRAGGPAPIGGRTASLSSQTLVTTTKS